jgi:hypothetical protein
LRVPLSRHLIPRCNLLIATRYQLLTGHHYFTGRGAIVLA